MIKATLYYNNKSLDKISSCYFQALPRVGEEVYITGLKFKVDQIRHNAYPVSLTNGVSFDINQPKEAEIMILCSKLS